jgi:hypothetical protein
MVRLVEAALLDIWHELRAESTQQATTAKKRVAELERRKQRLVQAYVYDQAIDRPTYDRELTTLDEALTFASLELRDAQLEDLDLEAALGYARSLLTSTSKIWEVASAPRKRRLQTLMFPEGVSFDGKGLRTPTTAFIFSLLVLKPVIWRIWWSRRDSNPRPPRCERGALPAELLPHGREAGIVLRCTPGGK